MNYEQSLKFLNSFINLEQNRNVSYENKNYNLLRSKQITELLNCNIDELNIFHVAGTNGKGSVATMFYTLLNNNNIKTGLYISPHVFDITERIQIAGNNITKSDFANIITDISKVLEKVDFKPSYFEILTAMAVYYFSKNNCKWAVLETGLGGRLDSTNAFNSKITAITSISLDHTDKLGSTLEKIAYEKAGIIKDKIPVILGNMNKDVINEISKQAKIKNAPMYILNKDFFIANIKDSVDGTSFIFNPDNIKVNIPKSGLYVSNNAAICIQASKMAGLKLNYDFTGLNLPARFDIINKSPYVILDGAHNQASAQALANTLKKLFPNKKIDFILGFLKGKNYSVFIDEISDIVSSISVCRINDKNDNSNEVYSYVKNKFQNSILLTNPLEYMQKKSITKDDIIVISGSFYLCSEILSMKNQFTNNLFRR